MDLNQVKELLNPYLVEHQFSLYDLSFVKEAGYLVLQVLIDKKGGIDIDELAECNDYLFAQLDKIDADMGEYMLEVSSPGAEKVLRSIEEIKENVHAYVHVEIENMIYEGTLEDVTDLDVTIRFNAKGRFKTIKIPYEDIKLIRLAVKI